MKKSLLLLFAFVACYATQAQVSFHPGVRAGMNLSYFTKGDIDSGRSFAGSRRMDTRPIYDTYIGAIIQLNLGRTYALQPELNYSRQGSHVRYYNNIVQDMVEDKLLMSYLSLALTNKFRFKKVSVIFGHGADFLLDSNYEPEYDVDLAFMIGAGYQINRNLGIEARLRKGVVPVLRTTNSHTNVNFSIGLTYTFEFKF